jgi:hypothetical protein
MPTINVELTGFVHFVDHVSGVYFDGDQCDNLQPVDFRQVAPKRVGKLDQNLSLFLADSLQRLFCANFLGLD